MPQPPKRNIDFSKAARAGGSSPASDRRAPGQEPYRAQRPLPGTRSVYHSEATGAAGRAPAGMGNARPQAGQATRGTHAPPPRQTRPPARTGDAAFRQPAQAAQAGTRQGAAHAASYRAAPGTRQTQPQGAARGTNPQARRGAQQPNLRRNAQALKKKKLRRRLWITLVSICAVVAVCGVGLKIFLDSVINTGEIGSVAEEIKTPPQLSKDQMSLLVLGIDFTAYDGKGVQRDPIGQTDMLLYLRFNFADNTLRMLQIPRDMFVGKDAPTGGTGKLNGLYKHGENQDKNRVNNVAVPVSELFQLPVDGYVAIDMVSLREIVDVFGGINVYVATEHNYKGSYIPAGWQTLHGDMLEFFLRDRYNTGTGDIGRLDTQRYFYSALFRLLRTATWQDIVKLTPVAQNYVNTDLSAIDCAALAIRMLKIPSSNIMMGRVPTFDSTENYNENHAVQIIDAVGTADVLNQYFRTPETLVTAEQYHFADWPHAEVAHEPNIQWMNDVDADGGGTIGEAAGGAQTGDDLLNPPASGSTGSTAA